MHIDAEPQSFPERDGVVVGRDRELDERDTALFQPPQDLIHQLPANPPAAVLGFDEDVMDVSPVAMFEEGGQRRDTADGVADDIELLSGHDGDGVVVVDQRAQGGAILAGPLRGRREGRVQLGVETRQLAPHRKDLLDVFDRGPPDLDGHGCGRYLHSFRLSLRTPAIQCSHRREDPRRRRKPSHMPIVEVVDLFKRYGDVPAVDHIGFVVESGEVFGILGPNGAGKTTTLEIIEGLRRPDGGRAVVDGVDVQQHPREVRSRIGMQLQQAGFFERLTVDETLQLFAAFHRRALPGSDVIHRLQLDEKRRARVDTLSGGQLQRLSVAVALINDPRIVFLDEPTTGLDPQARRALWEVIGSFRREGRTVILTTHYMEEAQHLCDRVAIMDHGRIVAQDTPRGLIRTHAPGTTVSVLLGGGQVRFDVLPGVQTVQQANGEVILLTSDPLGTVHALMELNRSGEAIFQQLRVEEATLEDVFLQLTGRRLRE